MRLQEARRDYYRRRARGLGYRSRAVFKLLEIERSYHIFRRGMRVVDLGCAPGGWLQLARKLVGSRGIILGVDLKKIEPITGVEFIQGSIEDESIIALILQRLKEADLILSDMSPNISGIWSLDHARQISLVKSALSLADKILARNGTVVLKVFEGDMLNELREEAEARFEKVRLYKPKASRKASSEIYLVCLGFRDLINN